MTRLPLRIATAAYRSTPLRVRQLMFNAFLKVVRNRHVVTTVEGMRFDLDLGQMIDVAVYLERYEPDIVHAIERLCRPGWCAFDIGANIGAHTMRLAKAVGSQGAVYAFEPTDFAYRKLLRNLELNDFPQAHPFRVALSDADRGEQQAAFRSSWRSDGKSEPPPTTMVEFSTMDTWCAAHDVPHVDLIKLDVDGHEFPILAGGRGMLKASRPIVLIEASAWHFQDPARNPLGVLRDLAYRFWDTKTFEEYRDLDAIHERLPDRDDPMGFSINVLAMTTADAINAKSPRQER
jgi:FkbM family methyltransferase